MKLVLFFLPVWGWLPAGSGLSGYGTPDGFAQVEKAGSPVEHVYLINILRLIKFSRLLWSSWFGILPCHFFLHSKSKLWPSNLCTWCWIFLRSLSWKFQRRSSSTWLPCAKSLKPPKVLEWPPASSIARPMLQSSLSSLPDLIMASASSTSAWEYPGSPLDAEFWHGVDHNKFISGSWDGLKVFNHFHHYFHHSPDPLSSLSLWNYHLAWFLLLLQISHFFSGSVNCFLHPATAYQQVARGHMGIGVGAGAGKILWSWTGGLHKALPQLIPPP